MTGIVTNTQQEPVAGASVIAIHEPSGTTYEAVTRTDGRFSMPGMRVGGPYSVTIAYVGAGGTAFAPETQVDIMVNLGVGTDLVFTVQPIAVQEEITVTATGRSGVQFFPHRRRRPSVSRVRHRDDADGVRKHRRPHAADATGERPIVRRPG